MRAPSRNRTLPKAGTLQEGRSCFAGQCLRLCANEGGITLGTLML